MKMLRFPALLLLPCLFLAACATPSDLPELDVSGPNWSTWQGQAVWESKYSKDPLIGEFVTGLSTTKLVRFAELTKGGVPIIRARRTTENWEVQFVPNNIAQKGKGSKVSKKWIFLHLPDVLNGSLPPEGWTVERKKDRVILTNAKQKETLELLVEQGPAVKPGHKPGFLLGPP
jgi:hypothetical protein